MCGIAAAYVRAGPDPPDDGVVQRMVARQSHRGPDNASVLTWPGCRLGANRLRILDPRPAADQPFTSDEGDVHLLLNGEVFNHLELRPPLERSGVRFRTRCDSETVLHLYLSQGVDMLAGLEGQFALCIVDRRRRRLVLARDRLGVCPLYVVERRDLVYVASSVEALLSSVPGIGWSLDREAVEEYLLLRFVLAPRTVVSQIRALRPAEVVVYDDGGRHARQYWHLDGGADTMDRAAPDELRESLARSVRLNAVCDVPLAAFLSGGLDSSIVVAEASQGRATPLDTLSIDFGEHSEEDAARASCAARVFGCRHHPYRVAPSELRALALGCLDAMDHPLGARDAAATFALARRLARELPGTKVVLTGTGADELFAGYGSAYFGPRAGSVEEQCAAYVASYACTSPSAWRALGDVVPAPLPVARVAGEVAQRVRRLGPALSAADPANVLCAFYLVGHLPGWELATQDAMCMASSIEPRVPFLGRRVVELAMATSGHRKRAGGREKAVLRDAYAGRLPEPIRTRPKVPLSRPVAAWLCAHGIRDLYLRSGFRDRGLLRVERLRSPEVLSEFDVMWRLMALERWLQRNFD